MSIWKDAPKNSRAVYEYLKVLAKRMRTESYGEIARVIGMSESRKIAAVSLRYPLGFIRDNICQPRCLPWLNALAVNGDTWVPGDSFLPEGVTFGDAEQVLWRGTVLAVFAYPWNLIVIE
jgi:alkylated DNA nucleotide flippase Atl1